MGKIIFSVAIITLFLIIGCTSVSNELAQQNDFPENIEFVCKSEDKETLEIVSQTIDETSFNLSIKNNTGNNLYLRDYISDNYFTNYLMSASLDNVILERYPDQGVDYMDKLDYKCEIDDQNLIIIDSNFTMGEGSITIKNNSDEPITINEISGNEDFSVDSGRTSITPKENILPGETFSISDFYIPTMSIPEYGELNLNYSNGSAKVSCNYDYEEIKSLNPPIKSGQLFNLYGTAHFGLNEEEIAPSKIIVKIFEKREYSNESEVTLNCRPIKMNYNYLEFNEKSIIGNKNYVAEYEVFGQEISDFRANKFNVLNLVESGKQDIRRDIYEGEPNDYNLTKIYELSNYDELYACDLNSCFEIESFSSPLPSIEQVEEELRQFDFTVNSLPPISGFPEEAKCFEITDLDNETRCYLSDGILAYVGKEDYYMKITNVERNVLVDENFILPYVPVK